MTTDEMLHSDRDAFDIQTFCKRHSISRGMFYKLLSQGNGPDIIKVGRRTLITREAAAQWRASRVVHESNSAV